MKLKVFYISKYDFTDKSSGRQIKGVTLHTHSTELQKNKVGYEYVKISLGDIPYSELLNGMTDDQLINREVNVSFNRFGKVDTIQIIK